MAELQRKDEASGNEAATAHEPEHAGPAGSVGHDRSTVRRHMNKRKERADAYHEKHANDLVAQFRQAAGAVCDGAGGGGIDFFKVRSFQTQHNLRVDGLIGHDTIEAAQGKTPKAAATTAATAPEAHADAAHGPAPAHDDAAEHHDAAAQHDAPAAGGTHGAHDTGAPMPQPAASPVAAALAKELIELLLWEAEFTTGLVGGGAAPANGGGAPPATAGAHGDNIAQAHQIQKEFADAGTKGPASDASKHDHKDGDVKPGSDGGAAKKTKNAKELVEVYGLPGQVKTGTVTAYFGGPEHKHKEKHKGKDKNAPADNSANKEDNAQKPDTPHSGHFETHALMVPIFQRIMNAIRDSPNQDWKHILQKPGSYVPRPMRPDPTTWSIHSWGVAIDVNEDTNRYGAAESEDQKVIHHYFTDEGLDWLSWDPMHFQNHDARGTSLPITDSDVRDVKAGKAKIDGGATLRESVVGMLATLNAKKELGPKSERLKARLERMLKILDE